ncbi:MAG: glycosyltransferase family 8 protein [Lentisphaerae bacterium]|nr:glycosyltransferase family 8 protein [Lentisphaerota bacterium]
MNNAISIACGTDKNYVQHAAVMLCSLFENNKDASFNVYILTEAEENISKAFLDFVDDYGHKVNIIVMHTEEIKKLPLMPGYPHAVYYPMFLPELLPRELEKIIYFDTDIVINGDISELWDIDLGSKPLAAVRDYLVLKSPVQLRQLKNTIKIKEDQYFNSGSLVFNLDLLRNENFTEKCLCWAHKNLNQIMYPDQDIMNAVTAGNWLRLPPKYNASHFLGDADNCFFNIWSQSEILEARKKPVVIHYIGRCKPWHYKCTYEVGKYFKYLEKTPWRDFKYTDKTILTFIKKYFLSYYGTIKYYYSQLCNQFLVDR